MIRLTYSLALLVAYDRQLFGAQAYAQARITGETRSSQEIFRRLCFKSAMVHLMYGAV